MIFDIRHRSHYRYSRPVYLEPQTIRLRPRQDASQQLLEYAIQLTPEPDGASAYLDAEGNQALTIWYNGLLDHFSIENRLRVETLRSNPFDFLIDDPGCESLPIAYPAQLETALQPCLGPRESRNLSSFIAKVRRKSGDGTLDFLQTLCDTIYRELTCTFRHKGAPYSADETLERQGGSCRDLAVLFCACCRQVGLAARFVSGYQEGDPDQDERQLHAWAEVYLPGGGWRGYDPTHGLSVADRHVAVAASHHSSGAAPVSGSFRGTGVESRFEFELEMRVG